VVPHRDHLKTEGVHGLVKPIVNNIPKGHVACLGVLSTRFQNIGGALKNLLVAHDAGVIKRELHGAVSFL
jgi:hypothetical protein